jgi:hypothetical protein
MIYISHRGNLNGKFESYENEPTYILSAIEKGYDVEVDVWCEDGNLYLGHDKPQYGMNIDWFKQNKDNLWIHCKNKEAVEYFSQLISFNWFWHETDTMTLTSDRYIWVYPGKQPIANSIAVLPEIHNEDVGRCSGICSDFIERYRNEYERL